MKKACKAFLTVKNKKNKKCFTLIILKCIFSLISFMIPLCFHSRESKMCEILIEALWTKTINELKFRGEMVERIEKRHQSINRAHKIIEKKIKVCIPPVICPK